MQYDIKLEKEEELLNNLKEKTDTESLRIKRYLSMDDLSRKENSPIKEIVDRILKIPDFKDFDIVKTSEVAPTDVTFDLYDFADDHPARSKSDTYYLDEKHILRPHTTVMWYYYLTQEEIKKKIENEETLGFFSFGKVYRKDEVDRNHMNVFHQMDGGFLIPKNKKEVTIEDLQNVLSNIAKAVFGPDIKYRFNKDSFPYTDPSLEMEIDINGKWLEVLGCGIMTDTIIKNLGLDPEKWSNWAFGFGLERLAMISMELPDIRLLWSDDERVTKQLKLGQKFIEVSKYPAITRDISFIVPKTFVPNDYFDLVREIAGDMLEEISLMDKYENDAKFGADKMSYAFHIVYRSIERTLTSEEIDSLHKKVETETTEKFSATIR
jgi:phenylalanyl-tRNA synthetase alpha chain